MIRRTQQQVSVMEALAVIYTPPLGGFTHLHTPAKCEAPIRANYEPISDGLDRGMCGDILLTIFVAVLYARLLFVGSMTRKRSTTFPSHGFTRHMCEAIVNMAGVCGLGDESPPYHQAIGWI